MVNAVAAARRYKPPMVIVDFGTATTFDVVDADGDYCGGAIAPGQLPVTVKILGALEWAPLYRSFMFIPAQLLSFFFLRD